MAKKQGMEQRMGQRRMEQQKRQLTSAISLDSRRRMSETAAIAHQTPIGGSGRTRKPVQIVSPEKKGMGVRRASTTALTSPTKVGYWNDLYYEQYALRSMKWTFVTRNMNVNQKSTKNELLDKYMLKIKISFVVQKYFNILTRANDAFMDLFVLRKW